MTPVLNLLQRLLGKSIVVQKQAAIGVHKQVNIAINFLNILPFKIVTGTAV